MSTLGLAFEPDDKKALGRLFSRPTERVALDRQRLNRKLDHPEEEESAEEAPIHEQFTHNGYVKRSSGLETTWINQKPVDEIKDPARELQNVRVRQNRSKAPQVVATLPSGEQVVLKVGQTFDANTNTVHEQIKASTKTK